MSEVRLNCAKVRELLEPYFEGVRAVFVEWASVGEGVLPPPAAIVRIAVRDDGTRQIDVLHQ